MTNNEFQALLDGGAFIAKGEYRSSKAEWVPWRNDKGQEKPFASYRHVVEFGNESVHVNCIAANKTEKDIPEMNNNPPFKKGTPVVLKLQSLTKDKGILSARGELEELTPSGKNGALPGGAPKPA